MTNLVEITYNQTGESKSTAVIIAGGKSSRMGRDKALLPFGEFSTLAEYQYRRLSSFFDKVYISAKSNKFDFDVMIVEDRYEVSSPLVAIVSIFETLDVSEVFVLSVDAPFISIETIEELYQRAKISTSDIIVAKSPYGVEPLCAIYRRSVLPLTQRLLEEDNHRLQTLLNEADTTVVEFEDKMLFTNLNHPKDYEMALITALQASV